MVKKINIATRKSPLALAQANLVKNLLLNINPNLEINLIKIVTDGDKWLDSPLNKIGGKGLFIKALEEALIKKEADIAVHSLKDVPAKMPEGLMLAAFLARESPLDAFVSRDKISFCELPKGATIGTSSLRRQALLKIIRPDLNYVSVRGNVGTRLKKLDDKTVDGLVLAHAGLIRLNMSHIKTHLFTSKELLPAVGQGAIVIQTREGEPDLLNLIQTLNHKKTEQCVKAERYMNALLGGSCQVPVAGHCLADGPTPTLTGLVATPDGKTLLQAASEHTDPKTLGEHVGRELLDKGAKKIIDTILRGA